jgi:hypothetical protein
MYCIFINMRYYIYILLDDRTEGNYNNNYSEINYKPFYIGKGDYNAKNKKLRHLSHYNDVILENKTSKINPYKSNTIKKLIDLGFKPNFCVIFETDNEEEAFKVEMELIKYYGRFTDGGILTNIAIGGSGGNTFTNNPRKEAIREKHRLNAIGSNNPMYGLKLEDRPSHKAKLIGNHWNTGRKASEETKNKMKENAKLRPNKEIVVINSETLEEIDILTIYDLIAKYNIKNKSLVYRCIKHGGSSHGYFFRYVDSDLVLCKTIRPDYEKPIDDSPRGFKTTKNGVIRISKLVYYKEDINSETEIVFNSVFEASEVTGLNSTVIRRKCKNNNFYTNIFRYENEEYTFDVKTLSNQKKVKRIDKDGNELIFESLTSAAEYMDGKITSVLAVCKGRNKTYRGFKFEYVNN